MSLYVLGIRDFPILHRQLSSPTMSKHSPSPSASIHAIRDFDLTKDSKDVLIQRLNDLSARLADVDSLEDEAVTTLHIDVDRMEKVIRNQRLPSTRERSFEPEHEGVSGTSRGSEEDPFWGPLSPGRQRGMRFPDSPTSSLRRSRAGGKSTKIDMTPQMATVLASQALELQDMLEKTLGELRKRKEETDHVHSLLVTRAEAAAQRVIELEDKIGEVNIDFEETQSELSFLRLQLRALEVQAMDYIPPDDDLSESIKNWKLDWADVDQRTKARRRKCKDVLGNESSDLDDSQTIVDAV